MWFARLMYLCLSEPLERSTPGCTSPSLRPDAPSARSASFSISRTLSLYLASSRATEQPDMPPPMTRTSGLSPSSALSLKAGTCIFSSGAAVKTISFTTCVLECGVAAVMPASTTSFQSSSSPVSTMQPSLSLAVTLPANFLFSFLFRLLIFIPSTFIYTMYSLPILYRKYLLSQYTLGSNCCTTELNLNLLFLKTMQLHCIL